MKKFHSIPVLITVSRDSGKVEEVQRGTVAEDNFRKICQALTQSRKEGADGSLGVADTGVCGR